MKYQALIEYEYPVDHPKPVGAAIYLHGEKIIADSVRRVKMPEHMDLNYKGAKIDFYCRPLEQEPTTKNDLGVDCVSRQAVDSLCWEYLRKATDENIAFYENFLDLPSVTPQEPRKGQWIDIKNKNGTVIAARCSRCGNSPKHAIKSDFCPNCGSDMREVEE